MTFHLGFDKLKPTRDHEQAAMGRGGNSRFAPTDREAFKAMLERAGVKFDEKDSTIAIGTEGPRNEGYCGFVAEFVFSDDGSLELTGVWE